MKRTIYFLFLIAILSSCSSEQKNVKENIAVVEQYITAVENMDYETMEALLDENYYGLGPSFTDSINKTQALESWKYNVEYLYEQIKYNRIQNAPVTIAQGPNMGDWVSSWAELKITYKSGDEATIWANTVYKVKEGSIVKTFTFYNEADVYRQLGYFFIDFNNL